MICMCSKYAIVVDPSWPTFCEEELGVAAARMLKAGSSPADPNSGTDMVLSAAEKAENLLRGLHVILPVDQD